uniref:L-prolyl-[peptidyl carrier protein] dehydrogenase n=1 Tax=Candidatus Kentrum sp. FW TaxID=2126338 RepID=A0A450U084_9GAMM|nr:MAG: L-prolyl-[peptidyl carrier protein] dehydrogenase [Candidatus Kentron sp. FW]
MDFSWSKEALQLKKETIEFAQKSLTGDVIDLDRREVFNYADWKKCAEFGIHGLRMPERYGGRGLDILSTMLALEGLGYGCKDNGLMFAMNAQMWACQEPLLTFGTEEQKEKYLPKLCRGEWVGGHAASEPAAGSDVYALEATARREGDVYILNGHKIYITNGPVSDLLIIFANVDKEMRKQGISAFMVEKDAKGLTMNGPISKMGMRTTMMGELFIENCEVPVEDRLGKEGAGLAIFAHGMEWERGFILAYVVGVMERLLEQSTRFAKQRKQFGQPISKFQLVTEKLVAMKMRLEASKSALYKLAWLKQNNRSIFMEAAMTKLAISEAWVASCMDAAQIHGALGYLTEPEIERGLRDAIGSKVYSGTSEIQQLIIAQFMGL